MSAAPATPTAARRPATPATPVVPATAPTLAKLDARPAVGDVVFVPRSTWPRYACHEYNSAGWAASVVSTTRYTCVVAFLHARAPDGRRSADERVQLSVLKRLV